MKCRWKDCKQESKDLEVHLAIHINQMQMPYKCEWKECLQNQDLFDTKKELLAHINVHIVSREISSNQPTNNKVTEEKVVSNKKEDKNIEEINDLLVNKIYYEDELRRSEIFEVEELMYERKYFRNLLRILKDEIVRDKTCDEDWQKYLN